MSRCLSCLQVIAAVGCLARIPLPQGALRPIRVKRSGNRPAGTGQRATPPPQPLTGRPGSLPDLLMNPLVHSEVPW